MNVIRSQAQPELVHAYFTDGEIVHLVAALKVDRAMSDTSQHKPLPSTCKHDGYRASESSFLRGRVTCCKCGKVLYERGPMSRG